ncbi:helix-turn-helix domain-containing protein, partial [Diaminobutyricibacter tongyongensis]
MSRARVAVLKIVSKQLTVTAAAAEYGFSRRHLHRLLARYRDAGLDAVEPRSRAPLTSPHRVTAEVVDRIVQLR